MADGALEAILGSRRAFTVAAAGCGKTQLLGEFTADARSGRQLILTHTHAGLAAIKKRLADLRVPQEKFHVDTIAGWSLRYCIAYRSVSGFRLDAESEPDWPSTYPCAERVCRSALGQRVLRASYEGVLIDEYQDCSIAQHALIRAIADSIPCRAVGDPLQTVFGFREDPVVAWSTVRADFDFLEDSLTEPWRWRGAGRNAALGEWLRAARRELETHGRVLIAEDAPVTWVASDLGDSATWAETCRRVGGKDGTAVAILNWPASCPGLSRRLGGRWTVVERFDAPDLTQLARNLVGVNGTAVVSELLKFVAERMTRIGTELKTAAAAIAAGRGTARITKNAEHAHRLAALANHPTPSNALLWLDGALQERNWWLYRRECVFQLREALQHCIDKTFAELPAAVAAARTRARHRGRHVHYRSIGTPLLLKGLEFDHSILLWDPRHYSIEGLYVALTRASKSLTIVSDSRTLKPTRNSAF